MDQIVAWIHDERDLKERCDPKEPLLAFVLHTPHYYYMPGDRPWKASDY